MKRSAVILVLLALILAGCSGSDSSPRDAGSPDQGRETGSVAGLVVDDERRPIEGASLELQPGGRTTTSNAAGRFLFEDVARGDYTLVATREGYEPAHHNLAFSTPSDLVVSVVLVPLPKDEAFHETFPFQGLQQCMVYTNVFLASCSYPYTAAYYTALRNGINLSQYGAPSDVLNNRYRYNFSVRPEHTGIVSELAWVAQTEASRYYVLQLSCAWYDPLVDDCLPPGATTPTTASTYARARGISPLRIEWKHEKPQWLPWVMSRAYLSGPVERPAGAALDQRIEMYNSVFYGGLVPAQWSVFTPAT